MSTVECPHDEAYEGVPEKRMVEEAAGLWIEEWFSKPAQFETEWGGSPSYRSTYMRLLFTLLLCALCLSGSSAAQPEVIAVPLIDKTGAASPFEVSGSLLLQETVHGSQLEWSWGQKVAVKNVSGKAVLLFVATLTEIGRHPKGRLAAPGDGPTYQLGDDRFFSENLILPDESLVLRDTEPGTPDVACCINPLAESSDPIAEFHLRFVQFADGSTFGDLAEARDYLEMRETILRGLRELNQSYAEHGKQGFAAKLKEQSSFSASAPFNEIVSKYREGGIRPALDSTRQILATAEKHMAVIAATAATSEARAPNR